MNLPTEPYIITLHSSGSKPTDYKIEPLSQNCKNLIERLELLGADVIINDDEKPTSIFINYHQSLDPINFFNHEVVGADLQLHLFLLGGHTSGFEERLQNFLTAIYDIAKNQLPEKYKRSDVKFVTVRRSYEF